MTEKYVKPDKKYLLSYYEACKETWGHVHNNYILHNPDEYSIWKNNIFNEYNKQEKGIDLPKGYVPSVTYWIIDNEEYIGTINIRLKLNDALLNYGGHIGAVIRNSKRKNSYGTKCCKWATNEAISNLKISPVLITCYENNVPSLKILLSSRYSFMEKSIIIDKDKETKIRRFWYE